ncbi:MAG: nickel pincer cofactor biosynthesis protein LarC [Dehalococcoidales bacterium]|nr:nickel pincer cofactor biosynthesis protein LarC [Dehalococcoidales bacterium]
MSRIAYFDCFSGCSGDMVLGALLDTGLSLEALADGLKSLGLEGYRLSTQKVKRSAISATKFDVILEDRIHQHERLLSDILEMIDDSRLSERVKKVSGSVFRQLGEAEAKIHGVPLDRVHFHEVGAVDSIIDIVGSVLALEILQIESCYSSALPLGSGHITTQHGTLPVPVPAALQLLSAAGAPVTDFPGPEQVQGELVTPTGAALISSLCTFRRPDLVLEKSGYGAGSKDFGEWPNVLRVWIGQGEHVFQNENLVLLETNIDDMNPQVYGYLMDKLFAEQAADVWFTPIQMKKNRPAVLLSVLCPAEAESVLVETILRETSTLGIRIRPVTRHITRREIREFDSSLGRVRVKVKRYAGKMLAVSPEYEDCRLIAREKKIPLQEVLRRVENEAFSRLTGS